MFSADNENPLRVVKIVGLVLALVLPGLSLIDEGDRLDISVEYDRDARSVAL